MEPDVQETHRQLARAREGLSRISEALHRKHEPWGKSVYDLYIDLSTEDGVDQHDLRIGPAALRALTQSELKAADQEFERYVVLGGTELDSGEESPWSTAWSSESVKTPEHAAETREALDELRAELLPELEEHLRAACSTVTAEQPDSIVSTAVWLEALQELQAVLGDVRLAAFLHDLESLATRLAPAEASRLKRFAARLLSGDYRNAICEARPLMVDPDTDVATWRRTLLRVIDAQAAWRVVSDAPVPSLEVNEYPDIQALMEAYDAVVRCLKVLSKRARPESPFEDMRSAELREALNALHSARAVLLRLPELRQLRLALDDRGLARLRRRAAADEWDYETACRKLGIAWSLSVLDEIMVASDDLGSFDEMKRIRLLNQFQSADHKHISTGPARVRRAWAGGRDRSPQRPFRPRSDDRPPVQTQAEAYVDASTCA